MIEKMKKILRAPYWFARSKLLYALSLKRVYFLCWHDSERNFGDSISPWLLSCLTDRKIISVVPELFHAPHIVAVGSIIERSSSYSLIWGSGFISENSKLNARPKKVFAVRGPKTRNRLLKYGINCPEVYGDPVLLLPKLYSPKIRKRYELGVVPHYVDKNNPWVVDHSKSSHKIKIIDLQKENLLEIIDDILSCERVISSSLHGIITADAYGIPSLWVQFSDKVLGGGFKFVDYFESVKRSDKYPVVVNEDTRLKDIYKHFSNYKIDIDLDKLLKAAPFDIKLHL